MSNKYKLLKDLPELKAGAILTSSTTNIIGTPMYKVNWNSYNENNMIRQTDWFAPYLFTTPNGLEVYAKDELWYINCDNEVTIYFADKDDEKYKDELSGSYLFETKEKAQEYLNSLQEFKVGDIVVYSGITKPSDYIFKIDNLQDWQEVLKRKTAQPMLSDGKQVFSKEACRKATDSEIISYYEQQGWVKGAKFKDRFDNDLSTIDSLQIDKRGKLVVWDTFNQWIEIEYCTLIKEPTNVGGFGYLDENGEIIIP